MIPLKFYRDDEYVYYNNPNGITRKMTIADFEALMSGNGSGSESDILKVTSMYDESTDTTTLDKTYAEITSAMADGKIVILCESYLDDDENISFVSTGIVTTGGINEDDESNPYNYVDIMTMGESSVSLTRYADDNDILVYHSQNNIPPTLYQSFVFVAGTINASGKDVYNALASKYCYFTSGSAGTNNAQSYTATEYGKTGSTYYVVLSNGDRYEGGTTGNMTKVIVNP